MSTSMIQIRSRPETQVGTRPLKRFETRKHNFMSTIRVEPPNTTPLVGRGWSFFRILPTLTMDK